MSIKSVKYIIFLMLISSSCKSDGKKNKYDPTVNETISFIKEKIENENATIRDYTDSLFSDFIFNMDENNNFKYAYTVQFKFENDKEYIYRGSYIFNLNNIKNASFVYNGIELHLYKPILNYTKPIKIPIGDEPLPEYLQVYKVKIITKLKNDKALIKAFKHLIKLKDNKMKKDFFINE